MPVNTEYCYLLRVNIEYFFIKYFFIRIGINLGLKIHEKNYLFIIF
jgi:hypothetical protein